MNILLLSMPDYFEHMPPIAVRMPNGALTSLAGNVDSHHQVAVADLILRHRQVENTVTRLVREFDPNVVGLSVMTFQRRTAGRIINLVRALQPGVKVVVGGYDPSLASDAYEGMDVDFIVRGEGEVTFRELLRAIEQIGDFDRIPGLSYRAGDRWFHNSSRPVHRLEDDEIRLPNRKARVLQGYTLLGRQVDVIETSRGCTYDCSFCSIIEMRGRNFHTYKFDRVLADIADARDHGARTIFLVDDNITLNVHRFEALCHAIIDAGLNKLDYFVQAMTSAIATHGKTLAPLMREAGFRYVFLGIENILEGDLQFLHATAKNTERDGGQHVGNASVKAIDYPIRSSLRRLSPIKRTLRACATITSCPNSLSARLTHGECIPVSSAIRLRGMPPNTSRMALGVVLSRCSSRMAPDSSSTQYQLERSPRSRPIVSFC